MEGNDENRGVNFKALSELFSIKAKRGKDYVYKITVSMKEIYNETIRDLLATKESKENNDEELKIMTGDRGMYVKGLVSEPVQTEEEVLALFKRGNSNRSVGRTNMNEHSSRSHSMLTVEVEGENLIAGIKYFGKLHLVDLAGSERLSKSMVTGDRLKEAQAINKSLSALGNVIEALQKKNSHVPYRNSKLTYLLSDSLGGHAKTLMFINVSPNSTDAEETNCSLIFATRVRKVELGAAVQSKSAGETKEELPESEDGGEEKKSAPAAAAAKPKAAAPATKAAPAKAPAASASAAKKPATPAAKPAPGKKA
jgi:kinesin family protein C2/C3